MSSARRRRTPSPRVRLQAVLIITLMVLSLIGGRLLQLQGIDSSKYATLAQDQALQKVTLPAVRGAITDRDGHPIAETVNARDVVADPTQVVHPAATAARLAPVLHRSAATLTGLLSGSGQYALLAPAVSPALGDAVLKLKLPGITTLDTSKRVYPAGSLAANVVGYVGSDGSGLGGLEYADQRLLAGHAGERIFEVGAAGAPIPDGRNVVKAAVPGTTLRLSLQRDIQWAAQRAIAARVAQTHALSGTVIVENPRNGQILAMASAPTFDPNHLAKANAADLGNPAVSDPYEPGSVNKVITVSGALQDRLVTPDSPFVIPNTYQYAGTTFHDAENHGTEHLTVTGILGQSSNIGAIQIAKQLGQQRLYHYLRAFGFGQPSGIGLPGESEGLLPPPSQWSGTTLPTVSFGQGIDVTAVQVAAAYSTIANNGVRVTPQLVEGTVGPGGHYQPSARPARHRVVSKHVAVQMRRMLQAVVSEEGTAPEAAIKGYSVAGKTGTANRPNGHGGYSGAGYTASFVGMAPADNPKLVCEVVLQRPEGDHFGGSVAGPVFRSVMSFALQTMGIPPSFRPPPKLTLKW